LKGNAQGKSISSSNLVPNIISTLSCFNEVYMVVIIPDSRAAAAKKIKPP